MQEEALLWRLVTVTMSEEVCGGRSVENGQGGEREVDNGHPPLSPPVCGRNSVEVMVQQMKELITENNELKEAMRQCNQTMKDRFEELSAWREKLKEEREFYESKFKEARHCLAAKCVENDTLKKQLQTLEEKEKGLGNVSAVSQDLEQLKTQVTKLQAEKADLVGIISELQLKLNSVTTEDSFVEIRMHEGEASGALKENPGLNGKKKGDSTAYVRSRSVDEAKTYLESEELTVSQLLRCLRNETQSREALEKELQEHKDRLLRVEVKADDRLETGTQTEQEETEDVEARTESMGTEVETLNLQVSALFKELQEAHAKLKESELNQKQLQEKCQVLEKQLSAGAGDLDEKQKLLYTIKKLELHVESMQSEIKLEQAKTNQEKVRFNKLQDTYSKLLPELASAVKTAEEFKAKEAKLVDKAVAEELTQRLILAEKALAAKQQQIDDMKQLVAKQEEELETVAVLRAQMEVYCSDFHAERAAREKIHEEKEQLSTQLAYLLAKNASREDCSRNSLAELQTRHGARLPSGQDNVVHFSQAEREDGVWQQERNIPKLSCPKCGMIVPDIDTLQIHVMDCII